jgi:phage terminase Nu1 subunit (DNA packaging protein)
MPMTRKLWSINALAIDLDLDRRTVASRIKDVPPAGELRKHNAWWLADVAPMLVSVQSSKTNSNSDETAVYAAAIAKERADKLAMENAQRRGELIPVADMTVAMQTAFAYVRAQLLAIPTKAAPTVITLETTGEVNEHLTELIHDALREISETRAVQTLPSQCGRRR